jgi:hypothetical protein
MWQVRLDTVIHAIKSTDHLGVTSYLTTPTLRAFAVRRTPSIEGNKTGPSVFALTVRSARIIPLYGDTVLIVKRWG